MTIRQQGGIFGRNPTFNNVTVDGTLTVDQIVEKTGAAGITLDGVTLKDGNVVLADGKGIDFSATVGTGTSELLDDYEEGTFTASLTPATSGSITLSGTADLLSYTKVGRVVTVTGLLIVSFVSSPVGASFTLNNLPFTTADLPEFAGRFGGAITFKNGASFVGVPIQGLEGQTTITVLQDASAIDPSDQLYVQFTYISA